MQVVEQAAAAVDHLQQAAPAVVVLLVLLEVLGELRDPRGEQRDLDFRGTGVAGAALVLFDDLAGVGGDHVHVDLGPRILLVRKVQTDPPVDDTHADRRDRTRQGLRVAELPGGAQPGRELAPLADAVRRGDAPEIRRHLERVPPDTLGGNGETLLVEAIHRRRPASVEALLEGGADPNRVNARGETPVHVAAFEGDPEALRALLARGGDPDARTREDLSLLRALRGAKQRVWLATPYFLPTWKIRRALRRAAGRGVEVRLLLARSYFRSAQLTRAEGAARQVIAEEARYGANEIRRSWKRIALLFAVILLPLFAFGPNAPLARELRGEG